MKCVAIGSCMLAAVNAEVGVFGENGFAMQIIQKATQDKNVQKAIGYDQVQIDKMQDIVAQIDLSNTEGVANSMKDIEQLMTMLVPEKKHQEEIKSKMEKLMDKSKQNLSDDEQQILKNLADNMEDIIAALSEVAEAECEKKQIELMKKHSALIDKLFKETTMQAEDERLYWINNEFDNMIKNAENVGGFDVVTLKDELPKMNTDDMKAEADKVQKIIQGDGEIVESCAKATDNLITMGSKKILDLKGLSPENKEEFAKQISQINITEQTASVKPKVARFYYLLENHWSIKEKTQMKRLTNRETLKAVKNVLDNNCKSEEEKMDFLIEELFQNEDYEYMIKKERLDAIKSFAHVALV